MDILIVILAFIIGLICGGAITLYTFLLGNKVAKKIIKEEFNNAKQ